MRRMPYTLRPPAAARLFTALAALTGSLFVVAMQAEPAASPLVVTAGKSLVLDSPLNIQRVSLANGDLAEAVAVNPRELLINGKAPGETTLILWQQGGPRLVYDLTVRTNPTKLENVRQQISTELPGQDIGVYLQGDTVFLRGTAKDLVSAGRAETIAATLGKVVNLLNVLVPPVEQQILLKVRFADLDRSISSQIGINIFSTGAARTIGSVTTQQFSPPQVLPNSTGGNTSTTVTLNNALNIFMFRPDLNLGAVIQALQAKNLLQILAEPNVLAINGKPASFVAGGEFPVPVVRINFLPTITPRGTIRLQVTPEVSSLDYNNAVVLQGFTIPALSTRRVQTEVELENGQTFAVAGLLDNRFTETLDKIPGIGDIPILGKLFQSRILSKTNSELLVMVTPELVRPIPVGQAPPSIPMPREFLMGTMKEAPRTPGIQTTGPVPVKPQQESIPLEQLLDIEKKEQGPVPGSAAPPAQMIPVPATPVPANPGASQPAAPASQTAAATNR
jgi:pilus assembly protein CpaC